MSTQDNRTLIELQMDDGTTRRVWGRVGERAPAILLSNGEEVDRLAITQVRDAKSRSPLWETCPGCAGAGYRVLSCEAEACPECLGAGCTCDQCGAAPYQDGQYGEDGYETEGRGGCHCHY